MTGKSFSGIRQVAEACASDRDFRKEFSARVSEDFVALMRDYLEEAQLIGIDYCNTYVMSDGFSCATHDYLDANMVMLEAMDALADTHVDGVDGGDAITSLMHEDTEVSAAVISMWNTAWQLASDRGFSRLWEKKPLIEDDAAMKSLAYVLMERPDRSHPRYSLQDIRHVDRYYAPFPEFITATGNIGETAALLVDEIGSIEVSDLRDLAQAVSRCLSEEDGAGLFSVLHVPLAQSDRNHPQ